MAKTTPCVVPPTVRVTMPLRYAEFASRCDTVELRHLHELAEWGGPEMAVRVIERRLSESGNHAMSPVCVTVRA